MTPLKKCLRADRQLNRNGVTFQSAMHHIDNMVEIRAHNIHLVDISHTRNMVFVCLTPNSFRLWLNTALGTENSYRTVQHFQGTLNFYSKVNVTWGVDNIDTMALPVSR